MGWLQLLGSLKLQVSSAEYSLFDRALLQKRPIILSILLTEATTYLILLIHMTHNSGLSAGCVTVAFGAPNAVLLAPKGSIINIDSDSKGDCMCACA